MEYRPIPLNYLTSGRTVAFANRPRTIFCEPGNHQLVSASTALITTKANSKHRQFLRPASRRFLKWGSPLLFVLSRRSALPCWRDGHRHDLGRTGADGASAMV